VKLFIAADHAGFERKQELVARFREGPNGEQIEWVDLGPSDASSVDYPAYGQKLARRVLESTDAAARLGPCGVLICGSGVGISIAANRFKGIRAVLAASPEVAVLSRQHNASNVLCLGARLTPRETAEDILRAWLATAFEGGRHERRVSLLDD
jgi:ribose 5-phosphate isomerase B